MKLNYNLEFTDLDSHVGLSKIDNYFIEYLALLESDLSTNLLNYRKNFSSLSAIEYSEIIVNYASYLEKFIIELFDLKLSANQYIAYTNFEIIYRCKRQFVQRIAIKKYDRNTTISFDIKAIEQKLTELIKQDPVQQAHKFTEFDFAKTILYWQQTTDMTNDYHTYLEIAAKYAAYKTYFCTDNSVLFNMPSKLEFDQLLKIKYRTNVEQINIIENAEQITKYRQGFAYNGETVSLTTALNEVHYCLYCHKQDKDSCSKGFKLNNSTQLNNIKQAIYKENPNAISLQGCPLSQKISEMNLLKREGFNIAALAIILIDNPMAILTGQRICNDCMKSCIYQKQQPVDVPKIESQIVDEILKLKYGFEIYALLTRWNPLKLTEYLPSKVTNYKILVAGLGPAGLTLSHYLLNAGHVVIAIDSLKIEPLRITINQPIKYVQDLWQDLATRHADGFGGVIEYGITTRFDKNYLLLARILLERQQNFKLYGGIRLGSNITNEQAFKFGFDHIALCLGAGKPVIPNITNILAKGARMAADFLMSLHLGRIAQPQTLTSFTIRLPIAVIGGGLTAIDTACEALHYYPVQIEKFLTRYEILVAELGRDEVENSWSIEDKLIAQEFINHAKFIRTQRKANLSSQNLIKILQKWGGVTIYYRGQFNNSQAYKLNHDEVNHALLAGVYFAENIDITAVELDEFNYVKSLILMQPADKHTHHKQQQTIAARTILIATGVKPNSDIVKDIKSSSIKQFSHIELNNIVREYSKYRNTQFIVDATPSQSISYFGDLHNSFAGSVVKAMASAKEGVGSINNLLKQNRPNSIDSKFQANISKVFKADIVSVRNLTDDIIELVIKAPAAARNFKPGQFFKLQTFAQDANIVSYQNITTNLLMKPLALTGTEVDRVRGHITAIVKIIGANSRLCQNLQPAQEVMLMGPVGEPIIVKDSKPILLIGEDLGNCSLIPIGKAYRAKNVKVVLLAIYNQPADIVKIAHLEQAADSIIWCSEQPLQIKIRASDTIYQGNIRAALTRIVESNIVEPQYFTSLAQLIVIGSHKLLQQVSQLHFIFNQYVQPSTTVSVNSPMQCMMQGICGQCVQKHVSVTGEEYYVFSCITPNQKLADIDIEHLQDRLQQDSLQQKLTSLWLKHLQRLNLIA